MRNLIIAIVCAAAFSGCKGQRVVAGDTTAPQVATMSSLPAQDPAPATGESTSDVQVQVSGGDANTMNSTRATVDR